LKVSVCGMSRRALVLGADTEAAALRLNSDKCSRKMTRAQPRDRPDFHLGQRCAIGLQP